MIDIFKLAEGCEDAVGFIEELKTLTESKVKVYRTSVNLEDGLFPKAAKAYVFMTTSKDVHLAFGRLSNKGQQNLMSVITHTLNIEKQAIGLVNTPGESAALLATLAEDDATVTIHLSPAR